MARHELADEVAVVLRRAFPNEVSKDELLDQFATDELTGALESLREDGELDDDAEEYRWRDPENPDALLATAEEAPASDDEDGPGPEFRESVAPPSDRNARLTFIVSGSFAPARGQTDDGVAKAAQTIAEEVQNTLGAAFPNLSFFAEVKRLELFDKPRVLFDAEEGDDDALEQ